MNVSFSWPDLIQHPTMPTTGQAKPTVSTRIPNIARNPLRRQTPSLGTRSLRDK